MEWAIEECVRSGLPVAASMCIGPEGDMHGVSAGDCAVRMARAGAGIVGINCHFDPFISLDCIRKMKAGLEAAGLSPFLFLQPLGYCTPDAGKQGFIDLPEFPFALEPRICTRFDIHKFAREAFQVGVRYIGGCCGFQPYHIRSVHLRSGITSPLTSPYLSPYTSHLLPHRTSHLSPYTSHLSPLTSHTGL